jgi:quercetin dioxygenase-like cupin family protein
MSEHNSDLAASLGLQIYAVNPSTLPVTPRPPQCVNTDKLPWVDIGIGIHFKVLSVNDSTGEHAMLTKYPPGTELPPHRHSGPVFVYTLQGQWTYLEHDFIAGPGYVAHEVANSAHTLKVPNDAKEDLILLTHMTGNLITYDGQGNIWAIDDAQTQLANYIRLAKEQGIELDESLILHW